jgi:tetratricopeptide (TPR) repeat protein
MKKATVHSPVIPTDAQTGAKSRLLGSWLATALGLFILCPAAPAFGQAEGEDESRARIHFEAARSHYDNARFEQAASEFELAYKYSPRPEMLFNAYLAYRDAGKVEEAVRTLRAYLEAEPDVPNRPVLEVQLGKLEQQLQEQRRQAERAAAEPEPEPAVAPSEPKPDRLPAEPRAKPEAPPEDESTDIDTGERAPTANILPYAVGGAGLALLVGGTITGVLALDAEAELESSCDEQKRCEGDLSETEDRGRTLATVTDVLLVTGTLAVGTGIALYFLLPRETESPGSDAPVASVACTAAGCSASLRGSF